MFEVYYRFPGQNKICSPSKHYATDNKDAFMRTLQFLKKNDCEIVFATKL